MTRLVFDKISLDVDMMQMGTYRKTKFTLRCASFKILSVGYFDYGEPSQAYPMLHIVKEVSDDPSEDALMEVELLVCGPAFGPAGEMELYDLDENHFLGGVTLPHNAHSFFFFEGETKLVDRPSTPTELVVTEAPVANNDDEVTEWLKEGK